MKNKSITIKTLNNIFDIDNDYYGVFLTDYNGEEIVFEADENPNDEDLLRLRALNNSLKRIFEILKKDGIKLVFSDIKNLLNKEISKEDELYPDSLEQD